MSDILGIELVPAAVHRGVTFREAAEALTVHPVSALAVLDDTNDRVVGVFGGDDLLRGLFPRYLEELHHTAFARDDPALLARSAMRAASEFSLASLMRSLANPTMTACNPRSRARGEKGVTLVDSTCR